MELSASRAPPRIGKPAGGNCQLSEWFNKQPVSPLSPHTVTQQPPKPRWLRSLPSLHKLLPITDTNYHTWATISLYLHGISGQFKQFPALYQHPVASSTPPGNCNTEGENLASHRPALTPNGQRSSYWELAHKDNRHINLLVIYAFSYSVQGCLSRFLQSKKQSKGHYFDLLPGQMLNSEYAHTAGTKITRI